LLFQILTKDSVTVMVDGVVYFRVCDPIASVANVANADSSTRLLAQTTLRNVLGTKNLAELLSDRDSIAQTMQVQERLGLSSPAPDITLILKDILSCLVFLDFSSPMHSLM